MSLAKCVIVAALRDKSAHNYPLWQYDPSYEPLLQAMRERGEAVRLNLDTLTSDCDDVAEICHRDALALDGWYTPSAAIAALLREAGYRDRRAAYAGNHPTWRAWDTRYAARLREVAATIEVQS